MRVTCLCIVNKEETLSCPHDEIHCCVVFRNGLVLPSISAKISQADSDVKAKVTALERCLNIIAKLLSKKVGQAQKTLWEKIEQVSLHGKSVFISK